MDWKRIFDLKGLNWWVVLSGMGMNFILTSFLLLWATSALAQETDTPPMFVTPVMAIGGFLIPLMTAYVCGRLTDERFLTYAAYPLLGYLIPVVPGILTSGVFGMLMLAFGFLGAFNGATLAARRAMKRRHQIKQMMADEARPPDEDEK